MKTKFLSVLALAVTGGALFGGAVAPALAADPAGRSTVDVIVPVGTSEPPRAVVVERITMYTLLTGGWTPVDAALIPESGLPGSRGHFAHTDGVAMKLYKDGVYAYCGIAHVGGIYNDCRIVSPGSR